MEIGDDPVLHGAHGEDPFWRAAQHPLGLEPDPQDVAGGLIDGGDRCPFLALASLKNALAEATAGLISIATVTMRNPFGWGT
jgi:hypothetical protein